MARQTTASHHVAEHFTTCSHQGGACLHPLTSCLLQHHEDCKYQSRSLTEARQQLCFAPRCEHQMPVSFRERPAWPPAMPTAGKLTR